MCRVDFYLFLLILLFFGNLTKLIDRSDDRLCLLIIRELIHRSTREIFLASNIFSDSFDGIFKHATILLFTILQAFMFFRAFASLQLIRVRIFYIYRKKEILRSL